MRPVRKANCNGNDFCCCGEGYNRIVNNRASHCLLGFNGIYPSMHICYIPNRFRCSCLFPLWIHLPNRIIPDISIEIILILIPNRISLQEPPQIGRISPRLVVIDADLGDQDLAGILEPADVGGIGDAVGVISVDLDHIAVGVGDRGDAALPVGEQMAAGGGADRAAAVPYQRIINTVPVDITLLDRAELVIFQHQRIAVIDEAGFGRAALIDLIETPQRIIDQIGSLGARGNNQAVFCIIGEVDRTIAGEIAIGVIGERRGTGTGILMS